MPGWLKPGSPGSEFRFQAGSAGRLLRGPERITLDAYLLAGHFTADHPYMSGLDGVEHRADHAEAWVAEASGAVVAAVTLTFTGQPYSEIAMDNELEFRMLAVDPAPQGSGVGGAVVRQVIEHGQSLPAICAISITSATFMERAHVLYRVPPVTVTCPVRMCCSGCSESRCKAPTLSFEPS